MEVSKASRIIRVYAGHGESRRSKESAAKAVKVLSYCSNAEGTSTAGGGRMSSKHGWEKMIGETKESTGATEEAVISNA
jgi:hypothetical protein